MIYTERLNGLARKKAHLIADCARQRRVLADGLSAWQAPMRALDRGIAATRFLQAHPLVVAAVVGLVAVLGRRQVLRWASRGLLVWRGWQAVRMLLHTLNGRG